MVLAHGIEFDIADNNHFVIFRFEHGTIDQGLEILAIT